ncbi:TPA: hypothetical protein N0F65_011227 [Lagenidium giganteum]|uniref:Uncharacterized protein n=1 Tax=Lagenidium giganteum TaxID=4803 RepID=A0AAV2YRC4_9STRA|nr:TPA: hypothetical protein N0F65_011227 [Lagenidium giganteum]
MAWGQRQGIDDLLERLGKASTSKNLYVLSTRKITEADAKRLAQAIATNTQLEELYLSGHRIGEEGLQAFAECLAVNTALKHLCVGDDAFGDNAVRILSEGIAKNANSNLQVWDLEYKSVGFAGAQAIATILSSKSALATLTLSRNKITDAGVEVLVSALKSNSQPPLQHLVMTDADISGVALDHLAAWIEMPTCSLESLQLSFNDFSSASPAFFNALAKNKSLKKLQFKSCKLSDSQINIFGAALKLNQTLQEVDLSENLLTGAVCTALADGLSANTSVTILGLGENKCGDSGAARLAKALTAANTTLETLDLSKNGLTHEGVAQLLQATALKELRVFNSTIGPQLPVVLDALVANKAIVTFDVGASQLHGPLSVTMFTALHSHPSLRTLEMGGNSLGEEGHAALDELRRVNPSLDVAADKNAQDENGGFNHQQHATRVSSDDSDQQEMMNGPPPDESWRTVWGGRMTSVRQAADANLSLFRLGCIVTMVGSAAVVVRYSGVFQRFNHVDEIPSWYFAQNKKLRARIIRQCEHDPSIFYVYHTPFPRRWLLNDTLPRDLYTPEGGSHTLAVRPFGVQVDESSQEWVWANFVSSHRYVTLRLLHRMNADQTSDESVATCAISMRRPPFGKDLGEEIVGRGYGEAIVETMEKYDNGSASHMTLLFQRLAKLEARQKHAQVMQYGIWKGWQEDKLSERVVSAGKRATIRGFQRLVDKIKD